MLGEVVDEVLHIRGVETAPLEERLRALVNEVHCRGIHRDALGTHRGNGGGRSIHPHEVRMHVAVATERRRDRKRGVELSAERVDEHRHLLAGVLGEDEVHIVGIKVPTADVTFEMKCVFWSRHKRIDIKFMPKVMGIIRRGKDEEIPSVLPRI